jgi:hypothetical protein
MKPPGAAPPLALDECQLEQATIDVKLEEEELPIARPSHRFPAIVVP